MRVTGGIGKGRRLKVPAGSRVRPTSNKVKQALFNILGQKVEGALFLDLFAGIGGIGIEALSRGAGRVVFVDNSRDSVNTIKKNVEQSGFAGRAQVVASKAEAFLKKTSEQFDIVFLDPPYSLALEPLLWLLAESGILKPDAILIAEHFKKQPLIGHAGNLSRYRQAQYGDTVLTFYRLDV